MDAAVSLEASWELVQRLVARSGRCAAEADGIPEELHALALRIYLGDFAGALRLSQSSSTIDTGVRDALSALVKDLAAAEGKSMVFFPRKTARRRDKRSLESGSIVAESGVVRSVDGTELGYVYVRPAEGPERPPCSGVLLRWGGNAELAAEALAPPLAGLVASGAYHVVFADYRGYGCSSGCPSLASLHEDAACLLRALPELVREHGQLAWPLAGPLVVLGRSIGSLCALWTTLRCAVNVSAVVLDSPVACQWPFEQVPAAAWRRLAEFVPALCGAQRPMFCECCEGDPGAAQAARESVLLDPVDLAACLDVPLLLMVGTSDNMCPAKTIDMLFDAWLCKEKQVCRVEGRGHNNLGASPEYRQRLLDFLLALKDGADLRGSGLAKPCAGAAEEEAQEGGVEGHAAFGWCRKRSRS